MVGFLAAEDEHMPGERIGRQHIGDLRRQAIEAVAHADGTAGQIHLGARRNLDHDVAFKTDITRCSARSSSFFE